MILKKSDDKEPQIQALETLLNIATGDKKAKVQKELNMLRAGIKGEQEITYHIDFNLRDSENYTVIHDLRLEINGNAAQIDHLLINRHMRIYCIETKHFHSGIKINDDGEFQQWNSYRNNYEGIPSPLAQNERHIKVLDDIFDSEIKLPDLFGFVIYPSFHSRVAVNNNAKIYRSKIFYSRDLVKSDQLYESIKKDFDGIGFSAILKTVSYDELEDIAHQLIALHKPITINYLAKFGLEEPNVVKSDLAPYGDKKPNEVSNKTQETKTDTSPHFCKKCNSPKVKIQYGKFGYYYKCGDCDANSNIKVKCDINGHNAKLRKDGNRFYKDCIDCKTSHLYFEN